MELELIVWGRRELSRPHPLLTHLVDAAAVGYTLLAVLDTLDLDRWTGKISPRLSSEGSRRSASLCRRSFQGSVLGTRRCNETHLES